MKSFYWFCSVFVLLIAACFTRIGKSEMNSEQIGSNGQSSQSFEKMNELDTENVKPLAHCLPVSNVFREDYAKESLGTEKILTNAPQKDESFFKVPKILDENSGA